MLSKINRSECFSGVKGHCSGRGNFIYRIDSAKFSRRILFRGLAFSKIWRKQFSRAKARDAGYRYAAQVLYVYSLVANAPGSTSYVYIFICNAIFARAFAVTNFSS